MLLDLAQGGYLDLQCIDPVPMRGHSAAHELSHPAMLLEQHFQCGVSPFVRLYPAGSQQGDMVGRRQTIYRFSHFLAGLRSDELALGGNLG